MVSINTNHGLKVHKPKNLCLPLMSVDEIRNQLWYCFATATIANSGESFFLVSAAHSFVGMNEKPIYICMHSESVSLANHAVIKNEDTDIAAIKLGVETIDLLAEEIYFVNSLFLNVSVRTQDVREFVLSKFSSDYRTMVSGFPWNRNRMRTRYHAIGKEGLNVEAPDISDRIFGDDRYRKYIEIALCYDEKNCRDDNERRISPRKLQGMSGGPISEQFRTGNLALLRMQGILLRRDPAKRALFGVRYRYILDWVAANVRRFPEPPA